VFLFAVPALGQDGEEPLVAESRAPLLPDEAVQAVLTTSPDIRAAEAEVKAAQGQVAAARLLLENPEVEVEVAIGGDRTEVSGSQALSVSGEGVHARRAARGALDAAEADLRRARLEVAAATRLVYIEAVVSRQNVDLAAEGYALTGRLRAAVDRQLEEGEASTLDLRLSRMAEAQAAAHLLDARSAEGDALGEFAAMTQLSVTDLVLTTDPMEAAPLPSTNSPDADRADVVAARARLQSAEAEYARQRAATVPMVGIGGFYEREGADSTFGPTITVTLPLFDRNQAGRGEALGATWTAEADLGSAQARAAAEQGTAEVRLREADQLLTSVGDDLTNEASAALASVEAAYLAGEFDLLETVLVQAEILDGQGAALELQAGLATARIDFLLAVEDAALLPRGVQ